MGRAQILADMHDLKLDPKKAYTQVKGRLVDTFKKPVVDSVEVVAVVPTVIDVAPDVVPEISVPAVEDVAVVAVEPAKVEVPESLTEETKSRKGFKKKKKIESTQVETPDDQVE